MRATLIYHPGGGSAEVNEVEQARGALEHAFELSTLLVGEGQSPRQLAQRALQEGSELLVACGGDGTVSAVASALIGKQAALGILPRGTANSIATHLGIPSNLNDACDVIVKGSDRIIDTAEVNGRPMVLMATIGVHADAITQADPARKRKYGVLAYVLEELERMVSDDTLFDAVVEVDGVRLPVQASAITVANLAPAHTLPAQGPDKLIDDDGKLDITLIALTGFADALATTFHLATHAFTQRPATRDNIAFFRTPEVRIETPQPRALMVDGEAAGETPILVRCVPRSLRVRVPPEPA